MKLRFSMAHFSVWQRSPFRNSFMPSRRHCRQTGPMYLAKFFSLPFAQVRFTANGRPSSRLLLHSSLLRRTAAVVRNRRDVLDSADFNAGRGKRSDGGFAAGTRTADPHFDHPQPAFAAFIGGGERRLLGGEGSAFARPAKTQRAGAGPGDGVALLIGDGDDGVVEGGLDVHNARVDDALLLF